ncbi:MAG TPA: DUF1002 domain-containing protein [Methanothermobacter sp.]|uniref:DUF1002 domain-containing protein n=1 Tax=Methanothermobacter tenebrarum TaxID=680118 RepID=A0ABM7YCS1_9EURY|nr:DUF1002 domain-containing protein [Methanothermobacter tenebrarum]BDH79005.1 hypothetical protein MTTB_03840 [Methanothermobacter tenebrarum]HHW16904.1 DUF1002 domain-containing protein [Methanothermobacter sp.]HOQ20339.1 DUF1002 domain-containing protein [Methanothermobacter sp.]
MRYILLALILSILFVYGASGLSITIGETTYKNPEYKKAMMDYFQSKTDKSIKDVNIEVIRAQDVNRISENVTGEVYNQGQIFSCAMVDLDHDNLTIIVDQSKIKNVTPQMYANSLKSAGIERGYVVVSSPLPASGEATLLGIFRSYETLIGAKIPDEVKMASLKEIHLQTRLVNETGESGDSIAQLISEVKNRTEFENINDTHKIKQIVSNTADKLDINLTSTQIEDISQVIANSQKVHGLTTNIKKRLEKETHGPRLEDQLYSWLQSRYDYLISLLST